MLVPDTHGSTAARPRRPSGRGEIPLDGAGRDVAVRCAPHDRTAPQDDDLWGFVPHAGASGDELRQGPLRPDVHEIRLRVGLCRQERIDLIQGRNARRSGRAVLVQDRRRGLKQRVYIPLGQNSLHRTSMRRVLHSIAARWAFPHRAGPSLRRGYDGCPSLAD